MRTTSLNANTALLTSSLCSHRLSSLCNPGPDNLPSLSNSSSACHGVFHRSISSKWRSLVQGRASKLNSAKVASRSTRRSEEARTSAADPRLSGKSRPGCSHVCRLDCENLQGQVGRALLYTCAHRTRINVPVTAVLILLSERSIVRIWKMRSRPPTTMTEWTA